MASSRRATVARTAGRLWWLPLAPLGFLADRGARWRWLAMPAVVIGTALSSSAAKLAIRRPRPGSPDRLAPWGKLGAAGFPSTHSACAFAVAGWLRGSRRGRWLHLVAVLVGYSRVRRRAHHPGDVAAGAALGYAVAWQADRVWRFHAAARNSVRGQEGAIHVGLTTEPEGLPPLSAEELLTRTRGVRKRLDFSRPVGREFLRGCVVTALRAPSGSNRWAPRLAIVRARRLRSSSVDAPDRRRDERDRLAARRLVAGPGGGG